MNYSLKYLYEHRTDIPLDPNHTYFILFERIKKSKLKWDHQKTEDIISSLLGSFEKDKKSKNGITKLNSICLVLGDDLDTLDAVQNYLSYGIPCVFMKVSH